MLKKSLDSSSALVFGHRGAAGLAPENTLPSFALALSLGVDVLELDVHATSDGVIVVHHDDTLERTTNGSGLLREHTYEEIEELDAGYQYSRDGRDFPFRGQGLWIPRLDEVLEAFPDVVLNIEVKQGSPAIAEEVVRLLREFGADDRVLLAAEKDPIMAEIRRVGQGIPTGMATAEVVDFVNRLQSGDFSGYKPLGTALQIPPRFGDIELVTPESVAAAHAHGLEMHVWTINQRDEMEALLALGIDGIMSDLPGLARVVVDSL